MNKFEWFLTGLVVGGLVIRFHKEIGAAIVKAYNYIKTRKEK